MKSRLFFFTLKKIVNIFIILFQLQFTDIKIEFYKTIKESKENIFT